MKMNTAPMPYISSIMAVRGDTVRVQRRDREQQPTGTADSKPGHENWAGAEATCQAMTDDAGRDRAHAKCHVAQADLALARDPACAWRTGSVPPWPRDWHICQTPTQVAMRHQQRRGRGQSAGRSRSRGQKWASWPRVGRFLDRHAAQDRCRDQQQHGIDQQRERCADELDQRAGEPRARQPRRSTAPARSWHAPRPAARAAPPGSARPAPRCRRWCAPRRYEADRRTARPSTTSPATRRAARWPPPGDR